MARLGQWGAELGHIHAEGLTLVGTTLTYDTGTVRTGTRSYKFDASAACTLSPAIAGVDGRDFYVCAHILLPAATGMPGTDASIMSWGTLSVRLTTAGKLQLWAVAQQGSDSVATLTTDVWYRVEFHTQANSVGNDTFELKLDGTLVASATAALTASVTSLGPTFGWVSDPGTSEVIFFDDVSLNDGTGAVNTTWVGDQKIYALFPTADSAVNTWRDGAGGSTGLFGSVDNVPPTGVSTATSGATNQIENAISSTANYDATMTSYTTAGIGASDTVTAIIPVVEIGSSSTTGTDTLDHSVVSNPAIAATTSSCDIVAGTYPASWSRFTGIITENPSVTKGTAPVMQVKKNVLTTRINSCCLMAMVVAVSPAVGGGSATRYRSVMMVG